MFTAAIDQLFSSLTPHERVCRVTGERFTVSGDDIEMYRMLRMPPPTTSPWYRNVRREVFFPYWFRSSRCAKTGTSFVGMYRPDSPFPVYRTDVWWSDVWDPKEYGRPVRIDEPFFPQWYELFRLVPRRGTSRDPQSVNSEYSLSGKGTKDCYYVCIGIEAEDIRYGAVVINSRSCADVDLVFGSERCFDGLKLFECYRAVGSQDLTRCRDVAFLYDSRNCSDCFGGMNLRNQRFVFLGDELDEATYRERRAAIRLSHRPTYERYRELFREQYRDTAVHPMVRQTECENCTGTDIEACRNCYDAFDASDCVNVRYLTHASPQIRDCMDFAGGSIAERAYETSDTFQTQRVAYSSAILIGTNLEYCVDCHNCADCFGCVGLRNARHCILNRQYTEEEYWNTVDRLKTAMLGRGEYGEFFPAQYAPVPYEDSRAAMDHPIPASRRNTLGLWSVGDELPSDPSPHLPPDDLPAEDRDVLTAEYRSAASGRRFQIIPQELAFYRREELPLPVMHPMERMRERHALLPEYMRLYERTCTTCGARTFGDHPPHDSRRNVLCLPCYQRTVG